MKSLLSSRSGTVEIMKLALAIGAFGVAVVVNQGAIVACRRAQAATDAPSAPAAAVRRICTERDLRSLLVVTRDGVWWCPSGNRHRRRCGQRSKSRRNYADIKSVHQPLAFTKPIGVRLINRQIGDGRDREFSRRRACNRTGAAVSVPVVLIFLGTAMSAATACSAATSTAYMITDSNNLPMPCR